MMSMTATPRMGQTEWAGEQDEGYLKLHNQHF